MDDVFFDATGIEPAGTFEPLPPGDYEVVITESTWRPTKAGTGSFLELKCQVVGGDYDKRNLWARLNLKNPNATAVEIAKRELSAICHAVGVLRPKSKEELHGIPLIAKVVVRENQNGEPSNEIKGWKPKDGGANGGKNTAAQNTAAQNTAAPNGTGAQKLPTASGNAPW